MQTKLYTRVLLTTITLCLSTALWAEDTELAKLFEVRGVTGTIVITSLDGKTRYVHNEARAKERFLSASTFKIPNTLIALDEGAVRDEKEVLRWDGKDKGRPEWNKDHSMESAFPVSCVWFYQGLARRVGNAAYLKHLRELKYGNRKTGPQVDSFWLDGDLRISALEQIAFMKKLVTEELPYRKEHILILKKIMTVEETPRYTLRAKTGWVSNIGWYVGYVETKDNNYIFALNLDLRGDADAKYRQEITREALKVKGII